VSPTQLASPARLPANAEIASCDCRRETMLDLQDLRLVQAVHEQGSLVRAARVLGVAQPALTRRLAALEARLKGPLFDRDRRGVLATDLARVLLAEAAPLLEGFERLNRELVALREGAARELPVAAGAYAAEGLLLPAAARLLGREPNLRLRILARNWAEVPRALLQREAALGVMDRRGLRDEPGVAVEPLPPQPGLFFVRAGHPLAARPRVELADIVAFPLVFLGRVPRQIQGPLLAAREAARAAGPVHAAFPALVQESPSLAIPVVEASDAVVPLLPVLARPALAEGRLVALPWRAPWVSVQPVVLRAASRAAAPGEEALRAALGEAAAEALACGLECCARLGLDPRCA
jgi:DNA-binding transcriptional LysR family regulator